VHWKQQKGLVEFRLSPFFEHHRRFQSEDILERLVVERDIHQRFETSGGGHSYRKRQLDFGIDFQRFCESKNRVCEFSFVAHGEEILATGPELTGAYWRNSALESSGVAAVCPIIRQLFRIHSTLKTSWTKLKLT